MLLLLLSLGIGAVPDFISSHIDRAPGEIKQTYEIDYQLTFLDDDQALLVENDSPLLIASL